MTVYVECADPRVLAEHQGCGGWIQVDVGGGWTGAVRRTVEAYAAAMQSGYRFHLVFPSPEAAGKGLADYRDRLGAVVEYHLDAAARWVPSSLGAEEIASVLRSGAPYRIVAPAAPEEPPSPQPQVFSHALDDAAEAMHAATRPPLPDGVEPVAWSDRYGCWVLLARDVPDGWEIARYAPLGGIEVEFSGGTAANGALVLARPVQAPPGPETERVPWWEAVGRDLAGPRITTRVEAVSFDAIDGRAWCRTVSGSEAGDERGAWADADGCVTVLAREADHG